MGDDVPALRPRVARRSPRELTGALLGTVRPGVTLSGGIAAAAAAAFAGGAPPQSVAIGGVVTTLVAMMTMVVNDIYDLDKDRNAGVTRPLAVGLLSPGEGWSFALVLTLSALALAPAAPASQGRHVLVVITSIVAGVAYSPFARRVPLLKGFYTALACCLPLVYGGAIGGRSVLPLALVSAVLFNFGRELFLDAHHLDGDRRAGQYTLASVLGRRPARTSGLLVMFFASVLLLAAAPEYPVAQASALGALLLLGFATLSGRVSDEGMRHLTRVILAFGAFGVGGTAAG